jgi:hypothetical protein
VAHTVTGRFTWFTVDLMAWIKPSLKTHRNLRAEPLRAETACVWRSNCSVGGRQYGPSSVENLSVVMIWYSITLTNPSSFSRVQKFFVCFSIGHWFCCFDTCTIPGLTRCDWYPNQSICVQEEMPCHWVRKGEKIAHLNICIFLTTFRFLNLWMGAWLSAVIFRWNVPPVLQWNIHIFDWSTTGTFHLNVSSPLVHGVLSLFLLYDFP